jgi:DHA2 family multidrug resistance protein
VLTAAMGLSFYIFLVHIFTYAKPFITPGMFLDRNFSVGLLLLFV